jgi:DNA-directed RNA polymerase specialized sigma subunit
MSVEEEYDAKILGELITEYVRGLNARQQYIFVDRYYMAEPVEKIASDLSISLRTAYREIDKIKADLKKYLEGNGIYV